MKRLLLMFLLLPFGLAAQQDTLPPPDTLRMTVDTVKQAVRRQTFLMNLGPEINSPYDDSAPVVSPDGQTLFFWSTRPEGYGFQDIYSSKTDDIGVWQKAWNVGTSLNDAGANIVLSITPDGQMLLIYRQPPKKLEAEGGYSDLAIVRKRYGIWSKPHQLKLEGYNNADRYSLTASLAADGKSLILSYRGADSRGGDDLYLSLFDPETKLFGPPHNLGNINTAGEESTPFLAPDGLTLYFSSDRPGGLGGDDVYMTQRLDSTWRNWSTPLNLGPMVNTPGNELHFKFPAAAQEGFIVSNYPADTNYGGKDIFSITIPQQFKPKPVVMVKGHVLDQATKKPMGARITYMLLPEGKEIGSAQSDSTSGEYAIILPAGANYAVLAEGHGYIAISENLNTTTTSSQYTVIERDLYLAPIRPDETIRLNNLFFAFDSTALDPASFPELQRLVLLLKGRKTLRIEVAGHTDNMGDPTYNQQLSLRRAQAVVNYLIANGIEAERLKAAGYGPSKPVAPNTENYGRALNRRVEFSILGI